MHCTALNLCKSQDTQFSFMSLMSCPPALLARTEAHVWMPRAQQPFLPAYVPLDFPETSVRSALTAASLTLASTVATVQTMAWLSHVSVHTASLVSLVMTPPASLPAPGGPVPTRAPVLVNLMEPSGAFARNGLQVPHAPCSTDQETDPSRLLPSLWTECLLWLHSTTPSPLMPSTNCWDHLREICSRSPWRRRFTHPVSLLRMVSLSASAC